MNKTQWVHVLHRGSTLSIRAAEPGARWTVGRSKSAELRLSGHAVSRRHAILEITETETRLTDLGSRNGTYLDDERLTPQTPTLVLEGAVCRIGSNRLVFRRGGKASPDANLAARAALEPEGFEVCYALGKGAGPPVWAVRKRDSGRTYAVKFLDWLDRDPELRHRFAREARVCAKLRSPHIVRVYSVQVQSPIPFLIMELVEGPSLHEWLKANGRPSVSFALKLASQLAQALVVMEKHGVVHRDIKPANVLMSVDGRALLTDFGIAKDLTEAGALTETGTGLGTFAFMPPEQLRTAREVSPSADVYGLGATLYTLIAGRPPFMLKANDVQSVVQRVAHEQPAPLRERTPECPEDVEAFVNALLDKVPERRPSPASAVLKKLQQLFLLHGGLAIKADLLDTTETSETISPVTPRDPLNDTHDD